MIAKFETKTTFSVKQTFSIVFNGQLISDSETIEGTYTYEDPDVTLKIEGEEAIIGKVDGDTLTIDDGEVVMVFNKIK
jgi:hypothetical protein